MELKKFGRLQRILEDLDIDIIVWPTTDTQTGTPQATLTVSAQARDRLADVLEAYSNNPREHARAYQAIEDEERTIEALAHEKES